MLLPPLGGENGQGLAVTAVGVGAGDLPLRNTELLRQGFLQTGAVEGGEGGQLLGLQAGVDEGGQGRDVGRIEDHDDVLAVGAVFLDVVTELGGDLAVALEEVLTGHALLARRTAGGEDILRILEGDGGIRSPGNVDAREGAMVHFGDDASQTGLVNIIETDI